MHPAPLPRGVLAIVTCRGAGCGGRGSVGRGGKAAGGRGQEVRRAWPRDLWTDDLARRTTTLCGAAGTEMRPTSSPLRAGPSRVVLMPVAGAKGRSACTRPAAGDKVRTLSSALLSPVGDERKRINRSRGEHEASRKPHRVRNAGRLGGVVVTNTCAFCVAHEAADASCVRRSARPRFGQGATGQAPEAQGRSASPRRPNNRGYDASAGHRDEGEPPWPRSPVLPVPLRP